MIFKLSFYLTKVFITSFSLYPGRMELGLTLGVYSRIPENRAIATLNIIVSAPRGSVDTRDLALWLRQTATAVCHEAWHSFRLFSMFLEVVRYVWITGKDKQVTF